MSRSYIRAHAPAPPSTHPAGPGPFDWTHTGHQHRACHSRSTDRQDTYCASINYFFVSAIKLKSLSRLSVSLQPLQTLPSHRPHRIQHQRNTNTIPSLFVLQPAPCRPYRQILDFPLHSVREAVMESIFLSSIHHPSHSTKITVWKQSLFSPCSKM